MTIKSDTNLMDPNIMSFFDEFEVPDHGRWRAAVEAGLKGAPFDKKMISRTYEGIDLAPIFWKADLAGLAHLGSMPGFDPYARHTEADGYIRKAWDICQEIAAGSPEEFNQAARHDLEGGQTALNLVLDEASRLGLDPDEANDGQVGRRGLSASSLEDLAAALKNIDFSAAGIHLYAGAVASPMLALFAAFLKQAGTPLDHVSGLIGADPLGELAERGALPVSLGTAFDDMAGLIEWRRRHAPHLQTISVQGDLWHNAGGSAVEELACVLAMGVEYVRAGQGRGLNIDDIAPAIRFTLGVGGNFFMEIAKIRAARLLWARVVEAFGGSESSRKMFIHGRTSWWTKTARDPYVNMLRNTTEAFAAVMGGVNSLHVRPFDEPVRPADEFSRRVSRNLQLMLQEECHFTQPIDPVGGSWCIEALTDQLADKAWSAFQDIERADGMLAALKQEIPHKQCAEVAKRRAANLAARRDVVIGINQYVNSKEVRLEPDNTDYAALRRARAEAVKVRRSELKDGLFGAVPANRVEQFVRLAEKGATLGQMAKLLTGLPGEHPTVTPVQIHRGAEPYEHLRDRMDRHAEKTGRRIQVFLAAMGPLAKNKPRSDFSTGFFEVGGFEVIGNPGFDTVEEAVRAAVESGAPIAVICGADDAYPEIVPALTRQIKTVKPDVAVLLAGRPAADYAEAYKSAGLDGAIYLGSDCLNLLSDLQQRSGLTDEQ